MPLTWKDRIKVAVASGGTGTLTLGSAASGYQTFAAGDDAKLFPYVIENGTAWETGYGTYTHSGTTFARTSRTDSSSGSAIDAGTGYLYVDLNSAVATSLTGIEQGYIKGLIPKFTSTTVLGCSAGACYIESLGKVVFGAPADITPSSPSANTWYHIYAYSNSGVLTLEASTTAPVAFATPVGTAYSKTSDASRRYIYSARTNGSNVFYRFSCSESGNFKWSEYQQQSSPFRVLSAGAATTVTAVDCSAVVAPTALYLWAGLLNTDTGGVLYVGDSSYTVSTTVYDVYCTARGGATGTIGQNSVLVPCSSSQGISYLMSSSVGGGAGGYIDVQGFLLRR